MKITTRIVPGLLLALLFLPSIGSARTDQASSSTDSIALRTQAVKDTIVATRACRAIGDFYWEIGDSNQRLASGKRGSLFGADTTVLLASASKLPFAAYLLQRSGNPSAAQIQQLTMRAGYMYFVDMLCFVEPTVESCFKSPSPLFPVNSLRSSQETGKFLYSGGNFQKAAVDAGLGRMTSTVLQADIRKWLGADVGISVQYPGVASGLAMNANGYATLLRKIMNNQLVISSFMGSNKVCTLPLTCPQASFTPMDWYDWDYSIGHWVEREPGGADEAYNSIGLLGFYPWITPDKRYYGIISTLNPDLENAGPNSLVCGKNMRQAWFTGITQN